MKYANMIIKQDGTYRVPEGLKENRQGEFVLDRPYNGKLLEGEELFTWETDTDNNPIHMWYKTATEWWETTVSRDVYYGLTVLPTGKLVFSSKARMSGRKLDMN